MEEILNIFGIDWRLLLVQAINFSIVLVALWYFLYRPVVAMMERRRQEIEQGVKDAEHAAAEREKIAHEREEKIATARSEADEIVNAAKQRAQDRERTATQEAQEKSEKIISEAKEQAEEEHKRAIEESKQEIAKLAVLSAEKVLRESKTDDKTTVSSQSTV